MENKELEKLLKNMFKTIEKYIENKQYEELKDYINVQKKNVEKSLKMSKDESSEYVDRLVKSLK